MYSADRNMLKNEIHDIVISLENIEEKQTNLKNKFDSEMKELERERKNFMVKLSNL